MSDKMNIKEFLASIADEWKGEVEKTSDISELDNARVKVLGKKGKLTELLRSMRDMPKEQRPEFGAVINEYREKLENIFISKESELKSKEKNKRFETEKLDITLPGQKVPIGKPHPLTETLMQIRTIFIGMGFEINEGPEIEKDLYNFELLNIPKDHPARDMQDTFYVNSNLVLRTHTSPVQVRTMLEQKPPIRMICPGRVYRADDVDATHSPIFTQLEGLVIDKGITMSDLRGVLDVFAKELYGSQTRTKLRPSYFPFTEPSAEVDISCTVCGGKGCRVCKNTGWIEILGSGMVHPNVLRNCGIDPEVYSGFAFGMGLERVTNMKYGITDIRLLFENDIRFLKQF